VSRPVTLACSAQAPGRELNHYWSFGMGAERPHLALRTDFIEHIRMAARRLGLRYARVYSIFHEELFLYRERDGLVAPSFQYLDQAFDNLLAAGVKPFVTFSFAPPELASTDATVMMWRGRSCPPGDLAKWASLVGQTVAHWLERYGRDQVRSWFFEVWNEPNLKGFWDGTRSQYFELYEATVKAVKAVDPELKVGGPCTSNFVPDSRFEDETETLDGQLKTTDPAESDSWDWRPVWIREFLAHCREHDLPVDFISTHPYPTDWALDEHDGGFWQPRSADALSRDLARLAQDIAAEGYAGTPVHLTEWNSSPGFHEHTHDYPQAATFVVKSVLENLGKVESLMYWGVTDIFEQIQATDDPLHGGFGTLTRHGIPKPAFHGFEMLGRLGDQVLAQTEGALVSRHSRTGKLAAIAYNYPDELARTIPPSLDANGEGRSVAEATLATGTDRALALELSDLKPGAPFAITTIDADAGNLVKAWHGIGGPANLSPAQVEALTQASAPKVELTRADNQGRLAVNRPLTPWAVLSVVEL
jgi:xylan 1,4-beta-xylosidase